MERVLITESGGVASEILIGPGEAAGPILPDRPGRQRVAVISQSQPESHASTIAGRYRSAGSSSDVRVLPDREAAKTLAVAEETYLWLNSLGMTRDDTLVAVGGGALTDVGGFIGGTYLRGIETVLVPTTLLGAVDAAVGGKAAVNVGGKNLAGIFRHPARIIIDTTILEVLPRDLLIEGTAEAVKAGFIADLDLLATYERDGLDAPINEVVSRAVKVKAEVVSSDFEEHGRRAILNYGHTVGHAIEHVAGLPHGHSVAIGMVAAGAASQHVTGFAGMERQRDLIARLELPVVAPDVAKEDIVAALQLDKKRDATGLRMVLLEDFGRPLVTTVEATTVHAALSAVGIE